MSNTVSTITSKWQVTIPEDVRKELPFKVGQRIAWEVQGDKLVGRGVRSLSELAGCLSTEHTEHQRQEEKRAFEHAAARRHERITRRK